MITLYGHEPETTPFPSTPSSRPRNIPAQPALPPRQDDQLEEAQIMDRPAADGDGEVVEAPYAMVQPVLTEDLRTADTSCPSRTYADHFMSQDHPC